MKEKVNIKIIAERAGVSVATVSRVVNQNGRFSAETEARVRAVMKELDYHPNTVAKSLREKHSRVVAVVVPDITNAHFARLVLEIETNLFAQGYSTLICNTNESEELELRHVDTLISQRVGGIIFISGRRHYFLDGISVVYVDRRPQDFGSRPDCTVVESDNETGGYLAAKKLIGRGCRSVAALCSPATDDNHKMRYAGYCRAVTEGSLPELVVHVSRVSVDEAREKVKAFFKEHPAVDGLVCTTDLLAVGAMAGLKELRLRVPEDVKVTGYDDSGLAGLYQPSITSVRQPVAEMAEMAAALMLELMDGDRSGCGLHVLPVRLVERETTE